MSYIAIFIIAIISPLNELHSGNGEILVPNKHFPMKSASIEKIIGDRDLKAAEDDNAQEILQLLEKSSRHRRSEKKPVKRAYISCIRHDFHIDLRKVFGDQLIRPVTFNAYTCGGKCGITAHSFRGPFKNHAFISYMFLRNATNFHKEPGEFCCVPSSYESLTVVYRSTDVDRGVDVRLYPDMIVKECSCVYTPKKLS